MTKSPEMSVKMSMNASGSSGSVGKPGFGSSASRTDPIVGSSWLAQLAAVGAIPLFKGVMAVKTFFWKLSVSIR
jgi:hypothetical protein